MKLFIITNEAIESINKSHYCDNKDQKTTPEGLNKKFNTTIIARLSKKKKLTKF